LPTPTKSCGLLENKKILKPWFNRYTRNCFAKLILFDWGTMVHLQINIK
jgi:hypothetical protein